MFLNAAASALVATGAAIQIEHENAAALIESLGDVLVEKKFADAFAAQPRHRHRDQALSHQGKAAHHFEEVFAAEPDQFNVSERGAGRRSFARPDGGIEIAFCALQRARKVGINFGFRLENVFSREAKQGDFADDRARPTRKHSCFGFKSPESDADVTQAHKIKRVGFRTLFEKHLARPDPDKRNTRPNVIDDLLVSFVVEVLEQLRVAQSEVEHFAAIGLFKKFPARRQAHETIENVAANLPDLTGLERFAAIGLFKKFPARRQAHETIENVAANLPDLTGLERFDCSRAWCPRSE